MCDNENIVAEDVRLAVKIEKISQNKTLIKSTVICPTAVPQKSEHSIQFISDSSFELSYVSGSAYLYSEYYGLHSKYQIGLDDDIFSEQGTLLGFTDIDGKIPGGRNNAVIVLVIVDVTRG